MSENLTSIRVAGALLPSDVIAAVLAGRHDMWEQGVHGAVEAAASPRDKLLAVYDFLESWFGDDTFRGCGFINAFGELGATSPAVAEITLGWNGA